MNAERKYPVEVDYAFAKLELLELQAGKRSLTDCPGLEIVGNLIREAKGKSPDETPVVLTDDMRRMALETLRAGRCPQRGCDGEGYMTNSGPEQCQWHDQQRTLMKALEAPAPTTRACLTCGDDSCNDTHLERQ